MASNSIDSSSSVTQVFTHGVESLINSFTQKLAGNNSQSAQQPAQSQVAGASLFTSPYALGVMGVLAFGVLALALRKN